MMKNTFTLALSGLTVFALFVAGCKKSEGPAAQMDPPGVVNESTALTYSTQNSPLVQNDEQTFADQDTSASNVSTFMKVDSAIIPLRWGRFINPNGITRTFTVLVLPGDSIALVNIHRIISGNFVFLVRNKPPQDTTQFFLVQKPFTDTTRRAIVFKRVSFTGLYINRWVPVATSLVNGGTLPPNNNIRILSAVLYYPSGDSLVVTNPDTTFLLYRWVRMYVHSTKDVPEFLAGDRIKIRVTVMSNDSTGDIVALRYGVNLVQHKRALLDLVSSVDNQDGTFTRVYETSQNPLRYLYMHAHTGWFHFGMDAMTKGTLFDSNAPYSASWWAIPYRVF
jgi:hypothetical protein